MSEIGNLSQLRQLEAESIYIFREAVSQFERPILLYSIGKDSSVLVRLAQKAFYPGRLPFKLLHIDSTWKFREMIKFRDDFCREQGLDLIVHTNEEGRAAGVNPFDYGSRKYTDIMKTQALLQALNAGKYDVAFGGARRDEEKSRAKERIFSFRDASSGVGCHFFNPLSLIWSTSEAYKGAFIHRLFFSWILYPCVLLYRVSIYPGATATLPFVATN